ncbi:MAG: sigma-70 family RNA polymerase sigma factor [Blastocatellia bacterium]|nr:sigma-70 family RNA polymerase sigma factor [Blastocatellia bacterium]
MSSSFSNGEQAHAQVRRFATTHWSLILAAGREATPESEKALAALCATYWYPLYAYVRRKGYQMPEAQDMTQGFFARLLEKNYLQDVDRERGKFRSFLLASLNHFLANEWDRERAQKRGGGIKFIPLDTAEDLYSLDPADKLTPEKLFERRWATTLLDQVLALLKEEFAGAGKAALFDRLKDFLTGAESRDSYKQAAAELEMSEGAVKVAVHRMRRRFRRLLRAEIAKTVANPAEIDDEIRYLLSALKS